MAEELTERNNFGYNYRWKINIKMSTMKITFENMKWDLMCLECCKIGFYEDRDHISGLLIWIFCDWNNYWPLREYTVS
jgi:hypothetical protein